ncbi:MCE family protein [Actinomycetospora chiangmaiensis]|uniref:MCE family protein n=1 Tax=Actinomycetospora chiangmaiensis TaxID=402650 RepID=UPI00036E6EB5|nr:MCE family protein [Actinomycetospora chiangmaiensis]
MRAKLWLFTALTVVGVVFVAFRYAGLGPLVGIRPPEVRLDLADSGGLTVQNEVTYRGVPVGDVDRLGFTTTGVEAVIRLRPGAPAVPASAVAVVTNRSAIGEVYVDLQPPSADGPVLGDGSVIPVGRTRLPVGSVVGLGALDRLARSVPVGDLRRTVDELAVAFDRTGPDLGRLLDSSQLLVADARRSLPATTGLLRDGRTVLDTQVALGGQFRAFARDLAAFTDTLRRRDGDVRATVAATPRAADEVTALVRESGPDLGRTLANLLVTARILEPRTAGLEQFLVVGPWAAGAVGPAVLPGDGRLHFGLVLDVDDPPSCRAGYLQPDAGWRDATATDAVAMDTSVRCREAPPVDVRGAQHAPGAEGPGRADPPSGRVPTTGGPAIVVPGLSTR